MFMCFMMNIKDGLVAKMTEDINVCSSLEENSEKFMTQ